MAGTQQPRAPRPFDAADFDADMRERFTLSSSPPALIFTADTTSPGWLVGRYTHGYEAFTDTYIAGGFAASNAIAL